jgi:hypothetical protein
VARIRALPWARILAIAQVVAVRVGEDIPAKDRQKLTSVVRKSKGNPRMLSAAERSEVLRILRQVDYPKLGRDVAAAAATAGLLKRGRK